MTQPDRADQDRRSQSIKAMASLAGPVAHAFNNLLTSITGLSSLALREIDASHPVHADLEEIASAAQRAAALTKQLHTFARSQRLELAAVDLNAALREAEPKLRALLPQSIELRTRFDTTLPHVLADARQLEIVLTNLTTNARDAIRDTGSIEISTTRATPDDSDAAARDDYALLIVRDDGAGVAAADLDRIFDPFFTTKPTATGAGLGLPTVLGIVSAGGGRIRVESEPERGTTVAIRLPIATADAAGIA